jgi:ankyrin repeat protein
VNSVMNYLFMGSFLMSLGLDANAMYSSTESDPYARDEYFSTSMSWSSDDEASDRAVSNIRADHAPLDDRDHIDDTLLKVLLRLIEGLGNTPYFVEKSNRGEDYMLVWREEDGHFGSACVCNSNKKDEDKHVRNLTSLSKAASSGYVKTVQFLFDQDKNITDAQKEDALRWAASRGHANIVRLLLENGTNSSSSDSNGNAPLFFAVSRGHVEAAKLLLKSMCADHKEKGALLLNASSRGYVEIVDCILADAAVDWLDYKEHALLSAALHGHTKVVELLVGGSPKELDAQTGKGININFVGKDGHTALSYAAINGYASIVQILLDRGVNKKHNALICAVMNGHIDVVKLLFEDSLKNSSDINVNVPSLDDGKSILMHAVASNKIEMVTFILDGRRGAQTGKGVAINYVNRYGDTALSMAAHHGNIEIVRLLLDRGAIDNKSALLRAVIEGHVAIAEYLIDDSKKKSGCMASRSSSVDSVVNVYRNGATLLMVAAYNNRMDMVKCLLDKGAKVDCVDKGGETVLWYARQNGNTEMVDLLCAHGAKDRKKNNSGCAIL